MGIPSPGHIRHTSPPCVAHRIPFIPIVIEFLPAGWMGWEDQDPQSKKGFAQIHTVGQRLSSRREETYGNFMAPYPLSLTTAACPPQGSYGVPPIMV